MNVLFVLAQKDFRDEEYIKPREAVEIAGAKVSVASPQGGRCSGMLGQIVDADHRIDEVNAEDYDAVVVVGGAGSKKQLWNNNNLHHILQAANEMGRIIAGICLSSVVLAKAGILEGRKATVFKTPEALEELRNFGADYVGGDIVADGNIITASGPEAAVKFGDKIVERLASA